MFALRVTYLTGRVYSAIFDDGDTKVEPEWPPHPSRLFSALVSAWGEGGAEPELRSALEWLEIQGAPEVHAGGAMPRKLVQAFVPVNDSATLPEDRSRKGRAFPSATLTCPDVYFVWRDKPPSEVVSALNRILERTCALGHSASLVSVQIADSVPDMDGMVIWTPNASEGHRMRVPSPGRLLDLIDSFARFEQNPSKTNRPSTGASTLYRQPQAQREELVRGIFDRMIVVRRDEGPRGGLCSTLSLTAAVRGAFMKLGPQPVPEFVSGHADGSTAERPVRSERPHLAFVPLPFIGFRHATGDVMGLAVLLPRTLSPAEEELCWNIVGGIETLKMAWGKWDVSISDAEEQNHTLLCETWTKPGTVWSTVTPFVFDRFPKDPYGSEAEQTVRDAFKRVGFPEPVEIDLHYNPWHTGVPKASHFPPAPARAGKPQRYHCHVRIRFEGKIAGPIIAGAGRYYGYGLFRQHFITRGTR